MPISNAVPKYKTMPIRMTAITILVTHFAMVYSSGQGTGLIIDGRRGSLIR